MRRSDLGKRRRKVIIQTSRRGGINQEKKTSFEAFLEIGPLIICKRMDGRCLGSSSNNIEISETLSAVKIFINISQCKIGPQSRELHSNTEISLPCRHTYKQQIT